MSTYPGKLENLLKSEVEAFFRNRFIDTLKFSKSEKNALQRLLFCKDSN